MKISPGVCARGLIAFISLLMATGAPAQVQTPDRAWTLLPDQPEPIKAADAWIRPRTGQALAADMDRIRQILKAAPLEFTPGAANPMILELPDPTGQLQKFAVLESPVMEPPLAAQFPDIRTFVGQGITDPGATLRADVTMHGFHAQVLTTATDDGRSGSWYIDPYAAKDTTHYTSYYRRDLRRTMPWTCEGPLLENARLDLRGGVQISGTSLRTYRLACAATGEYTAFFGGTVAAGQAAIVTAINRVTGVYEKELTIRLTLVANNSSLVYTNSGTDPYTNNNGGTMLGQNQTNVDAVIGTANYDIGHVFSTGGGGIASLGVVCNATFKARGVTGSGAPTGDAFYIDYVAHEMGHQFGGDHTFNGTTSNCGGGNRSAGSAYEPGSGSTIMGYAGICGADNLQSNSDAYFHYRSHEQIIAYVSGTSCAASTATGNSIPTASAGADFTIPKNTPFVLTGSGTDANGDSLTYCWEEYDLGAAATLATADQGTIPLFRSYNPSTSPTRYFPQLTRVVNNTPSTQEKLPQLARTMTMRMTVRDNRAGGGGVNTDTASIAVNGTAGPFTVTSQATATAWTGGTSQTITWNVAGTTANGVNCANVAILLSTNGGTSFGTTILASTPNDGSETITVPNISTGSGRLMVQAVGNVFYNVNAGVITITPGGCSGATVSTQPSNQTGCIGGSASLSLFAGGTTPITYQWRKSGVNVSGATSATLTFNPIIAGNAGSYDCVVTNACGTATSNTVTLTVNTPVSISGQPATISRCPGQSASFSVTASGSPAPTYQWRKAGSPIGGATSSTYTIASVIAGDAGNYDCVVTNSCGSQTSSTATLTVAASPTITGQPISQTVCEGDPVSFLTTATGGTLTYQWRLNGSDISGANGPNYSLNPVEAANAGNYTCLVSNGCSSVLSAVATLTVRAFPTITSQPASASGCPGGSASFTTEASGFAPLAFQWRRNGVDISGATSPALNLTGLTAGSAGNYDCVVTNVCGQTTSIAATLTMQTAPSISGQPSPQTACAGASAAFSVTAGGSPAPTFQWRKGGSPIGGATGATLTINPAGTGDAGSYDCIVTNPCGSVTSNAASLTVNSAPSIGSQPTNSSACSGGSASFTVAASGTPSPTYQWRKGGSPIGGATSPTLNISPVSATDAGSYDCVVTNSCGSQTSAAATLAINTDPSFTASPSSQTTCSGTQVSFSVSVSGSPTPALQWRKGGNDLPGQTGTSLTIASPTGADAGSYDCVATNSCGSVTSAAATLTVNTAPSIGSQPGAASACEGQPAGFSITVTGTPSPTFQWRLGGVDIPGATGSTYNIAAAAAGDAGSYDCVITNSCGSVTSSAAALTLSTPPMITMQPEATGSCEGGSASLTVAASGTAPLAYQWRIGGSPISGANSPTLMLSPLTLLGAGSYDCIVSNTCGSATSNAAMVSVLTGPVINTEPSGLTACAGGNASFNVAATGATGYQWRRAGAPIADGPTGNGSTYGGATTDTLLITGVAPGDAANYSCELTASCGSVTSSDAALAVSPGVSISIQPVGANVCAGAVINLSVSAAGGSPLTYQWRRNAAPIPSATNPTYSITSANAAASGTYDCIVTDPCGSVTSDGAVVFVCIADYNCSGTVSVQDIFDFLAGYFAGDPRADVNGSGAVSVQDIFDFLAAYFAGCP